MIHLLPYITVSTTWVVVVVNAYWSTALAALVVFGVLSWWPKRAILSCFDRRVTPLRRARNNSLFYSSPASGRETETETQELSTLLEALREIPCLWDILEPREDRKRIKWQMIFGHLHEFPAVLRDSIRHMEDSVRDVDINTPMDPRLLNSLDHRIQERVRAFLFGFMMHDNQGQLSKYHGLDSNSVTEEEIEVVLRCFPELMEEQFLTSPDKNLNGAHPIFALALSETTVSFVPLFAKIGAEMGGFRDEERGGLVIESHNVLDELLNNTVVRRSFGREPSRELDDNSLEVVVRLRDMGMVTRYDEIYMIAGHLFPEESHRGFEFVASRLRLIINEWDPTLLRNSETYGTLPLLYKVFFNVKCREPPSSRVFGLILELGMLHYLTELGFVFHGDIFDLACEQYGIETTRNIINDELSRILARKDTNTLALGELVIKAATDADISLDAVYILIRREPIAVLPKSQMTFT